VVDVTPRRDEPDPDGAGSLAPNGHRDHDHDAHDHHRHGNKGMLPTLGPVVVIGGLVVALLARTRIGVLGGDDVRLWSTLFVSICIQALPFLVLGVTLSGVIAATVSPGFVERIVPRNPYLAVPAAGAAGIALPGCECGSVPIAGRLVAAGTPPAAALTFLLAAPAINPVVLIATAVAFPNEPMVVVARFAASLLAAVAVGWWWAAWKRRVPLDDVHAHAHHGSRWNRFSESASHDFVHAGGYLVVGAAVAASLQLIVPRTALESVAGNEIASIVTMAVLAMLLSICSEADAFVAAGLPQFSLTSRLVFLVVGPVIDLKLVAMQRGVFGARFTMVFAPVSLVVATCSAVLVGQVLL
jgi:uncharacterized membrane protein YraQ (UPF0718 family)